MGNPNQGSQARRPGDGRREWQPQQRTYSPAEKEMMELARLLKEHTHNAVRLRQTGGMPFELSFRVARSAAEALLDAFEKMAPAVEKEPS